MNPGSLACFTDQSGSRSRLRTTRTPFDIAALPDSVVSDVIPRVSAGRLQPRKSTNLSPTPAPLRVRQRVGPFNPQCLASAEDEPLEKGFLTAPEVARVAEAVASAVAGTLRLLEARQE